MRKRKRTVFIVVGLAIILVAAYLNAEVSAGIKEALLTSPIGKLLGPMLIPLIFLVGLALYITGLLIKTKQ